MASPKISLVTPSFNQAQFLAATIESILSQNYPNLEYIIIDGGSTDGSVEIIKKYEKYLHFWCSEPDGGQYDALNKGFSRSTGETMGWLNSDDLYFPWTLRTVSSIMSELPQVEWLTSLSPGMWDCLGFCLGFKQVSGYSQESFLDGNFLPSIGCIQQESTFWRRRLWEKAGGYISTQYKLASDFELWSRFYRHSELFATLSPLGGFRYQANQRSSQIEEYQRESQAILANMQTECSWMPNQIRNQIYKYKLNQIPKVRKLLIDMYSYTGKRVTRTNPEKESNWTIETYQFESPKQ